MSHRRLPTSNDQRRGRPAHTISDAPRTPPPPPDGLTAPEREAWRELWASPVSVLWTSDDVPAVVRLIRLRARIDAEGVMSCPVSLFSQVGQPEDRFALNPRARRQAGIVVVASGRGAQGPAAAEQPRARAPAARLMGSTAGDVRRHLRPGHRGSSPGAWVPLPPCCRSVARPRLMRADRNHRRVVGDDVAVEERLGRRGAAADGVGCGQKLVRAAPSRPRGRPRSAAPHGARRVPAPLELRASRPGSGSPARAR
jgi:hypothetical protein